MLTVDGVTKLAMEWAQEYGLARETVIRRMDRGWENPLLPVKK
jgi:hypothetical protein